MVNYEKPLSLSLLVYVLWLLGFVFIAFTVYVMFYGGKFWHDGLLGFIDSEDQRLLAIIGFSVFLMISGIGILSSAGWGRGLFIALCILLVIHGIIILLDYDFVRGLVICILCGYLVAYMFSYRVSSVFQPMDSKKAVNVINLLDSYRKSR